MPPTRSIPRPRALPVLLCLAALAALAVMAGCASRGAAADSEGVRVSVSTERLPGRYYAWVPLPRQYNEQNDPRALDPAFRQRLAAALDRALAAKGYQRVEDAAQAQWLAAYAVGVADRERVAEDRPATSGPTRMNAVQCTRNGCSQLVVNSAGAGAELDVRTVRYVEGRLQVEVLEPTNLEVLWRGVNQGTVRRADGRQARLDEIAAQTLASLPPAPR